LEIGQWLHWCIDGWLAAMVVIIMKPRIFNSSLRGGLAWRRRRALASDKTDLGDSAPGSLDITNHYQRVSFVF